MNYLFSQITFKMILHFTVYNQFKNYNKISMFIGKFHNIVIIDSRKKFQTGRRQEFNFTVNRTTIIWI